MRILLMMMWFSLLFVLSGCNSFDSDEARNPLEEKCHKLEMRIGELENQRCLFLLGCVGCGALLYLLGIARGIKVRDVANRQESERE